jgi:rod shape determining protein RodA
MSVATRSRRARPEPFSVRPGIAERLSLPYMDGALAFAATALAAVSVFVLSQATRHDVPGDPGYYSNRQTIYAVLGIVGMYLLARVDYSRFRELRVGIYTFLCVSISLVFVFGFAARGSRRAFNLPFFSFQPSELGKLLLVLALAGFVIDGARRGSPKQRTLRYLCLGLAPAALVFLQPDLGTSLVFGAITLAVMYVGGVPWTHFAVIGAVLAAFIALILVVAPAVGTPVLKGYQQQRLTSFLNPSADPSDAGYQQNQAKTAIGAGEATGRGNRATQTRLDFVPERHTDFIFAVIGERYGFIGAALVLSLYALLIWRALRIVTLSKNSYGMLVAGGIAGMLLFQVFVNVGMNLGIMPITGIPLPLMSYGGSSVLATFLAVGVLQSVHMQARLSQKGRLAWSPRASRPGDAYLLN